MEHLDVVVVGAGLSGIGAAVRLQEQCPDRTFAIFEARDRIGGTWDLFRYPGIRSDSDMFTLGYPFRPWKDPKAIADGPSILSYIRETSREFGVDAHIRMGHRIVSAAYSSDTQRWTLDVELGPEKTRAQYTCSFLYLCSGYYSYESAHTPEFENIKAFKGTVVHPQWWPEDLDYNDKRVLIIGSGATAVTLVPAMAKRAAHVTMLQRSPTYVFAIPGEDGVSNALRKVLPERTAHTLARAKQVALTTALFQFCKRFPEAAKRVIRRAAVKQLPPGYPVDTHFRPRYNPWDERLCIAPDGDFFTAIREGDADVVTATIDRFTERGVKLSTGAELEADVVVTATGLNVVFGGGVPLFVDGRKVALSDAMIYKGLLVSGVPNLACAIGYTNASWTLRADLSSRYVCKLLNFMAAHGHGEAVARAPATRGTQSILNLSSGYLQRALPHLPKQGEGHPWFVRQNYILDWYSTLFSKVDDGPMVFRPRVDAKRNARPFAATTDQSRSFSKRAALS
jgi:cation diffusion facilitator CzcD-associated flavoprotein CzcO